MTVWRSRFAILGIRDSGPKVHGHQQICIPRQSLSQLRVDASRSLIQRQSVIEKIGVDFPRVHHER